MLVVRTLRFSCLHIVSLSIGQAVHAMSLPIMNEDTTTTDDVTTIASISERLTHLQKEIDELHQRNYEKDRGKEFESSYTRVIFLMFVTYWTLFGYMALIGTSRPFLDAIVPTVGFNISTWSLPHVKELWIQARHYYRHGRGHQRHWEATVADL